MHSSWTLRWGWFVAGVLSGAVLLLVVMFHYGLKMDLTVALGELLNVALAFFLAMYIPFVIERQRHKHDQSRDMVISQVRGLVDLIGAVNSAIKAVAAASAPDRGRLMEVRTSFITANLRIGRLEKRVRELCGDACAEWQKFRACYDAYYQAVTGGSYYGNGAVTWDMWRQQEVPFVALEESATNLALRLHDQ